MSLNFRPDRAALDYRNLFACVGFMPVDNGYAVSYPATTFASSLTLAGDCLGAKAIKTESGSVRLFFGSAAKIEEYVLAAGLVDRSRAGGYATSTNRWCFSQGLAASEIVATNYADEMQISTGTAFSNLANAPKAKIVVAQSNALVALNYSSGGVAVPNGVWASDRGSSTTWAAADDNDVAQLKLVETPGEIIAGAALHDMVVVWKRASMYVGRFVAGDEKWQFNLLSPNVGIYGQEAWCATPAGIIFSGEAGTYLFDGSVPRPIDQGIRQTIQGKINATNSYGKNVAIALDEYTGCVFIYIPNPGGNNENTNARFSCYAYNYRTDRWSHPYPYFADSDGVYPGSDWGSKDPVTGTTYTGFQAVVRDFSVVDAKRITSGAFSPFDDTGHFVIPSQKKILCLNEVGGSGGDIVGVQARMETGRIKGSDRWDHDTLLRRVMPIWAETSSKYGSLPAAITSSQAYCTGLGNSLASLQPGGTSSTFTWSQSNAWFDGFVTGRTVAAKIGFSGARIALQDVWFDLSLAGKT